jgi:hypothetical protein
VEAISPTTLKRSTRRLELGAHSYRIVCTGRSQGTNGHRHVVSIGIGRHANSTGTKWTMGAVRDALDMGSRFYTVTGPGIEVDFVPFDCPCGVKTITPNADSDQGDVSLPVCGWAAGPCAG